MNTEKILIREASALDAFSLLKLDKACFSSEPDGPWNDDMRLPESYAQNGGIFLVGEIAGEIVAMGALRKVAATRGEIKRVRVHPLSQRQGLGRSIMQALENKARSLGYSTLLVRTDYTLEAAQQLYLYCGYQETKRDEKGVHFMKALLNKPTR